MEVQNISMLSPPGLLSPSAHTYLMYQPHLQRSGDGTNFTADSNQPLAEFPHAYRTNVAAPGAFLGPPMAAGCSPGTWLSWRIFSECSCWLRCRGVLGTHDSQQRCNVCCQQSPEKHSAYPRVECHPTCMFDRPNHGLRSAASFTLFKSVNHKMPHAGGASGGHLLQASCSEQRPPQKAAQGLIS